MSEAVWLIIPAYNVEKHLDKLLSETSKFIPAERTVVVNDGSTDRLGAIAANHGVQVIVHSENMGKGKSLRDGFDYVTEIQGTWAITIDGDLQHDPARIPAFIAASENGKYDIIIGKRNRSGTKMPWDRRLSNGLSSLLLALVTGQKMEDVQCGYRMIRIASLKGLVFNRVSYDFETELLLKLVRKGSKVGWVEIPTKYAGEKSSIRRLPDTMRFLGLVGLYLARRL